MEYRALPVFQDAAGWWRPPVNLADPGLDPVRVNAVAASGNLFEVLGVGPQIGPGFPAHEFYSREPIAVISDRLWRTRYSADSAIIGRQLHFNGAPYTIVGVMPPGFFFPDDVDVWQRLQVDFATSVRVARFVEAVARIANGTTLEQAQSAGDALARHLATEFPQSNLGWTTRLIPLLDDQLGYYRPALMVLFGAPRHCMLERGVAPPDTRSGARTRDRSPCRSRSLVSAIGDTAPHRERSHFRGRCCRRLGGSSSGTADGRSPGTSCHSSAGGG
jgi:hypothetical protein